MFNPTTIKVSWQIYDQLDTRDKRALQKMANQLTEREKATMSPFSDISDVRDWIREWREEGHII